MIGTIRRHQQWLWIVIITVTIISFVIWFSPDASWSNSFSTQKHYYVNGRPVTIGGEPISIEDYSLAFRETVLAYFMRSGGRNWPDKDEATQKNLERDSIYRVFLLKKMQDLDIHISDAAVAKAAHDRLGNFALANFEREYLNPNGLRVDDFERFLKHDLAIQHLVNVAGVSAKLYSPREGEALYRKEHEQYDTRMAFFWASNYLDKVMVTPDDVAKFYTNRMALYRLPERAVVSYVLFAASNYFAEADKWIGQQTNYEANIHEFYLKRGTNAFRGTNDAVLSESEAKKKIKEDIRLQQALKEAHRKASEFGNTIYDLAQAGKLDGLEKPAQAAGLVVQATPPLERMVDPDDTDTKFEKEFRDRAFQMTNQNQVSFSPLVTPDGAYIISLKNKIPSEVQPFDKIKDKVTTDFKNFKALEMSRAAGMAFHSAATNGLAEKKTFDQICVEAKVVSYKAPLFSSATTTLTNIDERINLRNLQQMVSDLKPGQISRYTPIPPMSPEGGFVLFLKDRVPVEDATVKKELPEYLGKMRTYRQNEAFNQWFRKQAEQSKLFIPPSAESTGITGR